MQIEVNKGMVDAFFDFIEGRRTKKATNSVVLMGVRGEQFPNNLLRKQAEEDPLAAYMDGVKIADIAARFGMSNTPVVYRRLGRRYERQIELYWTYKVVRDFIKPVLDKSIEEVFPIEGEVQSFIIRCYKMNILTVGDFIDMFIRNDVATVRNQIAKVNVSVFDAVFSHIRFACYALLEKEPA